MNNQDIPVIILCGGYGTRLSEETVSKPKPMVEIGPWPILCHIMKHYAHYGFKRFILVLGYNADFVKSYFYNYRITMTDFTLQMDPNKSPIIHSVSDLNDWEITCIDTGQKTLKGGRIKRVEKYIDADRFMLTYGDAVSNVNLDELLQFHLAHGKTATLTGVHPPSRFGELQFEDDRVTSFFEKPQLSIGMINGGYFVMEKKVMDELTPDEACDLEFGALQQLAGKGELMCFKHKDFWQCMDTIRDRNYLEKLWESECPPWKIWD